MNTSNKMGFNKIVLWKLLGVFALIPVAAMFAAVSMRTPSGKVTGGFQAPVFDEKGDLKTQFEGDGFKPLPDGRYLITKFKLKTFKGRNEVDLVAEAAECFFRQSENLASSPAALKVRQASGRFELDGEGFEWKQATGVLVVSNKVHTLIREGSTNQAQVSNGMADFEITADRLEYSSRETVTVARFSGNVVASQAGKLQLRCGELTVRLRTRSSGFEEILAVNSVEVSAKQSGSVYEATGDRAHFVPASPGVDADRMVIQGTTAWKARGLQGAGDMLTLITPASRKGESKPSVSAMIFDVVGNASVRVPPGLTGHAGDSTNRLREIDVRSHQYHYQDTLVKFEGGVLAVSEGEWRVRSSTLEVVTPPATNRVERINASGAVKIELLGQSDQGEIMGEQAILDSKDGTLYVTGSPAWKLRELSGTGDSVKIWTRSKSPDVEVLGRSTLLLPGSGLASSGLIPSGSPRPGGAQIPGKLDQAIQIESTGVRLKAGEAKFGGPVQVINSSGGLTSSSLVVHLDEDGKRVQNLLAEGAARLWQSDDEVRALKIEASFSSKTNQLERLSASGEVRFTVRQGDRATAGNGDFLVLDQSSRQARLEGHPQIRTESGITLDCEDRIDWDLVTRKIRARNYKVSGSREALKLSKPSTAK